MAHQTHGTDARPMMVARRHPCKLPRGLALGLVLAVCAAVTADEPTSPVGLWDPDAELLDVTTHQGQRVWAVGDRGVVWFSADGGQTWQRQPTPTQARLTSVRFLDARNGWIAGEEWEPHTGQSRGIVLSTQDGGQTWKPLDRTVFGGVARMGRFDRNRAWTVTRPSPVFPSGVFTTVDAGVNWTPLNGRAPHAWLCGSYARAGAGAVGGPWGQLMAIDGHELKPAQMPQVGMRGIRDLQFSEQGVGWAVGDGGLILRSDDNGASWHPPAGRLPAKLDRLFDFRSVAVHGNQVWVAGDPGSRILTSDNGGKSWQFLAMDRPVPINKIYFPDPRIGWAVGALGTIQVTVDGGLTWKTQHSGGSQAAILALLARPEDTPCEVLGRHAGNEGYLAAVRWIVRDPPLNELPNREALAQRAMSSLGVSAATESWRFPLPHAGLEEGAQRTVRFWNELHGDEALDLLEAELVRQIRTWRPSIVIAPAAHRKSLGPLDYSLNQIITRAIEAAADRSRYPEQIEAAGLSVWQVRKLYGSLGPQPKDRDGDPDTPAGDLVIDSSHLAIRLGGSLAEASARARAFLPGWKEAPPDAWGLQLLRSRSSNNEGGDLTSGIALNPGDGARRGATDAMPGGALALRRLTEQRRNVAALLKHFARDPSGAVRLNSQMNTLLSGLEDDTAAGVLLQAAERFAREGHWQRSAEIHRLLMERYPNHATAAVSKSWLIRYFSSEEMAWRFRRLAGASLRDAAGGALPPDDESQESTPQLSGTAPQLQAAAELFRRLGTTRPSMTEDPILRFTLASAERRLGRTGTAEQFLDEFRQAAVDPVWRDCARTELWLKHRQGESPRPVARCAAVLEPPHLDGYFDDDVWRSAEPILLPSGPGGAPAACMFAYDRQFLYLAISCRKVEGFRYTKSDAPRPRNADLAASDRIVLTIDTDRDWSVAYELTIDHRGWVAERLWEDASWNPTWYVAHKDSDNLWTIEAAIPLEELTGRMPSRDQVWGLGLMRIVPGHGSAGWTGTIVRERLPQTAGLLMFQ